MSLQDNKHQHLFTIGLLGGIGAGKSTVAQLFQALGAEIINADEVAHQVLNEPEIQQKIIGLWGEQLLVAGKIDRKALAQIVFPKGDHSRDRLQQLENLIHPVVHSRIQQKLQELAQSGKQAAVLDVPLLLERGLYLECDALVFVDTPLDTRKQRLSESRNWCAGEIPARERFQADTSSKKTIADHVIDNGNSVEQTTKQVKSLWNRFFAISND